MGNTVLIIANSTNLVQMGHRSRQKMKAPRSCFEAIKRIVRHGPLYPGACWKISLCGEKWCSSLPWLSPCLRPRHRHRLPADVHTNQISRASNWVAGCWWDWIRACHNHFFIDVKILCTNSLRLDKEKKMTYWCKSQWNHFRCFNDWQPPIQICLLAAIFWFDCKSMTCRAVLSKAEHSPECVVNRE